MKNALILHGKSNNSKGNWFPWLKDELEKLGWKVWVPNLPEADKPNIEKIKNCIFANKNWKFDSDSLLIGHSSGAVAILGLLQALPKEIVVDTCILVGSFIAMHDDPDWEEVKGLFIKPFSYKYIKNRARRFVFVHSRDDPHCLPEQAEYLAKKVGGELIMKENEGHFNLEKGQKYKKLPLVIEILEEK